MKFTPPNPHVDPPKIEDWSEIKDAELSPKAKMYLNKWEKSKQKNAEKMANKIANEKRAKRRDFLFELFKALIISLFTLAVEHILNIISFVQGVIQSFQ